MRMRKILKYLRLGGLLADWDELLAKARRGRFSTSGCSGTCWRRNTASRWRIPAATPQTSPHSRDLNETFPLSASRSWTVQIMSLYDRFDYMSKQRNIVWLGPTGAAKAA